ncbi:MAG: hypothetical protein ACXADL_07925 [Candidatus Thorarchaeota archaeon]|jgi:hypothetical protein
MGEGTKTAGRIVGIIILGIFVSQSIWYLLAVDISTIVGLLVISLILFEIVSRQVASGIGHTLPPDLVGRPRDSTMIQRVIVNRENEREYIVEGLPNTTFRDACIKNWPFKGIRQRSKWIIQDERGNDITSELLESYNSVAFIVGTIMSIQDIKTQVQVKELRDRSDEYSSLDVGVEFYD